MPTLSYILRSQPFTISVTVDSQLNVLLFYFILPQSCTFVHMPTFYLSVVLSLLFRHLLGNFFKQKLFSKGLNEKTNKD